MKRLDSDDLKSCFQLFIEWPKPSPNDVFGKTSLEPKEEIHSFHLEAVRV